MFTAKATNYRTLAKSLLTAAAMGHLRGNLLQGLWSIEVEEHSNGKPLVRSEADSSRFC